MQGLMNSFDVRGEDVKPRADDAPGVGGRARRADYAHRQDPAGLVAFVHNEEVPDTLTEATSCLKRALMMDHEQGGA